MRKPHKHRRPLRRSTWLPLYEKRLHLVVADDILGERKRLDKELGPLTDMADCDGLVDYCGRHFAMFIPRPYLAHALIAHEIFHLTHRIMQHRGCEFPHGLKMCHEPYAILNETLTRWVYAELHRARIKIPPVKKDLL